MALGELEHTQGWLFSELSTKSIFAQKFSVGNRKGGWGGREGSKDLCGRGNEARGNRNSPGIQEQEQLQINCKL